MRYIPMPSAIDIGITLQIRFQHDRFLVYSYYCDTVALEMNESQSIATALAI